jgi:hypothetical protein
LRPELFRFEPVDGANWLSGATGVDNDDIVRRPPAQREVGEVAFANDGSQRWLPGAELIDDPRADCVVSSRTVADTDDQRIARLGGHVESPS